MFTDNAPPRGTLFFSGVAGPTEYSMLREAGCTDLLVDPADECNVPADHQGWLFRDSGAYRIHKQGGDIDLCAYAGDLVGLGRRYSIVASADVFADVQRSYDNWLALRAKLEITFRAARRRQEFYLLPVYPWGDAEHRRCTEQVLGHYLDVAPYVGIGGLVPYMRGKAVDGRWATDAAAKAARDQAVVELGLLLTRHPGRFHLFGLNYLRGLEQLLPLARSADTSKWLDGGRYGHVIFTNTRTGHLSAAPARAIPEYAGLDRRGRCVESARGMLAFTRAQQAKAAAA